MDDSMVELYRARIKELVDGLRKAKYDPAQYKVVTEEIERLHKALVEHDKISEEEWHLQWQRKLEFEKIEAQKKIEADKLEAQRKIEQEKLEAQKKIEAEKMAAQEKWEKRKARFGLIGAIISGLAAIGGAGVAFAAVKSNQNFTLKCDDAGTYPDKNVHKTDTWIKFK